jgi:hypothetical protein
MHLKGTVWSDGQISWSGTRAAPERLRLSFDFERDELLTRTELLETLGRELSRQPWFRLVGRQWVIDLMSLQKTTYELGMSGLWILDPALELELDSRLNPVDCIYEYYASIESTLTEGNMIPAPPEIQDSLRKFQKAYTDPRRVGFVMMRFTSTRLHDEIVAAIKTCLAAHGLTALRADDTTYNDDVFPNILTYMHGRGFGIAVFERLNADDFNPNLSLELGYMMALAKPVCLLKDNTLKALHTDLVGKLYSPFDPQEPAKSIPGVLEKWLRDKDL